MVTPIDEAFFSAELSEPGIVIIRFKRHLIEHMKSLSEKEKFFRFLDEVANDESIKCVIALGNPQKRGEAEFEEWLQQMKELGYEPYTLRRVVHAFQQHVKRCLTLPQVVLTGETGTLTSSYLSAGLASDYFVLGEGSVIQNSNVKYNILPAGGTAWFLAQRVGRAKAFEIMSSEAEMTAARAEQLGLCNCLVPPEKLEAHLVEKARAFAKRDWHCLKSLKVAMGPDLEKLDEWFDFELSDIAKCMTSIGADS